MKLNDLQRMLKVLSILTIAGGVISILGALLLAAGGAAIVNGAANAELAQLTAETGVDQLTVTGIAVVTSVIAAIAGAVDLVCGILGLRAAKDATKIKPVWVLAIISLIFGVINAIGTLGTGVNASNIGAAIGSVVFAGLLFWVANSIKTQVNA